MSITRRRNISRGNIPEIPPREHRKRLLRKSPERISLSSPFRHFHCFPPNQPSKPIYPTPSPPRHRHLSFHRRQRPILLSRSNGPFPPTRWTSLRQSTRISRRMFLDRRSVG